jgi:hypothetical protein
MCASYKARTRTAAGFPGGAAQVRASDSRQVAVIPTLFKNSVTGGLAELTVLSIAAARPWVASPRFVRKTQDAWKSTVSQNGWRRPKCHVLWWSMLAKASPQTWLRRPASS